MKMKILALALLSSLMVMKAESAEDLTKETGTGGIKKKTLQEMLAEKRERDRKKKEEQAQSPPKSGEGAAPSSQPPSSSNQKTSGTLEVEQFESLTFDNNT